MVGISANPDAETLKILLWAVLGVLVIAVSLVGYFMSKRDNAITTATDNLVSAVEQLKLVVNGLQTQYEIRQPLVDEQLGVHYRLITSLAEENKLQNAHILTLQTEHALFHCKYSPRDVGKKQKKNEGN
jgi:hypothetical protein